MTRKPYFFTLSAVLISGIAAGFVQVTAYNQIANTTNSPLYFVVAFLLGTVPGIFTSHLGTRLAFKKNCHIHMCFIKVCFAGILFTLTMHHFYNNIFSIYSLEFISTAIAGIFYPIIQTIIKKSFGEDELPFAAKLDVFALTIQIIFGIGIGSILVNLYSVKVLLIISSLLYSIAGLLHLLSKAGLPSNALYVSKQEFTNKSFVKDFSPSQLRAYLMMPLLMSMGSPLFSLLPSLHTNYKSLVLADYYIINPVHFLMIARSIGQFLGPLLLPKYIFKKVSLSNMFMFGTLFIFGTLYVCITFLENAVALFLTIILAHSLSNIFYCLAFYMLQKEFTDGQMPIISAKQYRLNLLASFSSSFIFGYLSHFFGPIKTIWLIQCFFSIFVLVYFIYTKIYPKNICNEPL